MAGSQYFPIFTRIISGEPYPLTFFMTMDPLRLFLRKETTRNFMKLLTGSMIAQGMSLLLAPVLSHLYSPDDFGLVALYLSIFGLLSVISTTKYEQAIMLPKNDRDALTLAWLVIGISLTVSAITLITVIFFSHPLAALSGNPHIKSWLYFLPVSLVLHGLYQSATFYANRNKRFGLMARSTVMQYSVLNAGRIITGWIKTTFNGLIAGQLFAQLISTVFILAGIRKTVLANIRAPRQGETDARANDKPLLPKRSDILQQAAVYSAYPKFNMPLSFTNTLSASLPVFLLTWGFSPAIAGLYAFGFTFVFRPISLFSQSTTQVFSQKVIETHHHGQPIYPSLKKLVIRLLLLAVIPILLMALWAPRIFGIIFSEDYILAGTFLQYLSPYLLVVFITSPLSFIPEMMFRQKKAMWIDLVYLGMRFASLMTGIASKSLPLTMALLSISGILVVGYSLFWYLSLAKKSDASRMPTNPV